MNGFFSFNFMHQSVRGNVAKLLVWLAMGAMLVSMISCVATVPYRETQSIDTFVRAPIDMLDQLDESAASVDSPIRPADQASVVDDAAENQLSVLAQSDSAENDAGQATDNQTTTNASKAGPALSDGLQSGLPPMNAVYEPRLEIGDRVRVSYYQRPMVQKEAYLINPNDILSVDVLDHPELSRQSVLVLPDGFISVPLADRIQAVGKTTDQLGFEIGRRLNDHKISDPVVSVAVQRSQSAMVGLMDMLQARDGREPLTFIVDGAGTLELPLIEPISTQQTLRQLRQQIKAAYLKSVGPLLEVSVEVQPIRPLAVYVVGEVGRPGNVTYENGMHPFMAISTVGGFLPTANLQQVRLFRADANGQLHQWRIDMASEDELFAHGVKLLPRDILFIPRSGIAEANQRVDQYVRRLLPLSVGVGANYDLND